MKTLSCAFFNKTCKYETTDNLYISIPQWDRTLPVLYSTDKTVEELKAGINDKVGV